MIVKWNYQIESRKSDMTIGDKIKKIRTFRN
ncbi:MAG: XRE family transcriptional regulator, partial [Lachnospiraceae bacterium]|nr:XRE family transcriptional regulator [Lachnospiraceae bacterium]